MARTGTRWRGVIHKFVAPKLGVTCLSLACLLITSPVRLYADTGTWVDGDTAALSVDAVSTQFPQGPGPCFKTAFMYFTYGTNPNSIGHIVNATGCETQNVMGSFINSNTNGASDSYDFIKPGTSVAFRVLHPGGRQIGITPIPNQGSFMWVEPHPTAWGDPVAPHFFTNFAAAGNFSQYSYGSNIVPFDLAYELNTAGNILTDSAGTKIYMKAYTFSQNGKWMIMEAYGLGVLRVNMQTFEMQLIDQVKLSYNLGFSPTMFLAISDDGNSVIRSMREGGQVVAYDLSGCHSASFTFNVDNSAAMTGCRSRTVSQASLQTQLNNYQYMSQMRFSADGKSISAVAYSIGLNGITLYNSVHYSVAGYQAPHVGYLALGDSFSSGEGASSYEPGTDNDNPKNKCHLSTLSYPYLTAHMLGITDFHSVACSGATTNDYKKGQKEQNKVPGAPLGDWLPGYRGQKDYLGFTTRADVLTLSMVGNDVGFKEKLTTCILGPDDCFHFREDREAIASEFRGKFDGLVALYTDIKNSSGNSDAKVYVLGYPQIMGTDNCQLNVSFSLEERKMAQGMVGYLNAVIKAATISAGVQYIDVEHAFDGYRLCDAHTSDPLNLSSAAVNGLIRGDDFGPISSESFHPNALGHQLMSNTLLTQSQDFTKPMPTPNPDVIPPYIGSDAYNNLVIGAPSANLQGLLYTSPTTTVTRVAMTVADIALQNSSLTIQEESQYLRPNSTFQVWFYSDPVPAGTLMADSAGHLGGDITVPAALSPGFHTMHLIGKDIGGGDIDMYQVIYVAASLDDYNGDGVPNAEDACLIVPPSGTDSDHDGVDDACDGDIVPAPADTVPPQITGAADRQPDRNNWYNHDVTINWSTTDPDPSSGSPTQPGPTLASHEGDNVYTSDESCDVAGNCAAGSLNLKLDKTAPDITFTIGPMPNENGWNNNTAVVHFTCNDALSGIESCAEPITVSGSDGSYVVTGTAVDNAGNASGVNVIVNLDATAPQVTNNLSSEPNQYGWYSSGVTVTPSCNDNLSGIASCSQTTIIDQEGTNQVVMSAATDNAGNAGSATSPINLDKTPPTVGSVTWMNNPKATLGIATLSVHATDNLSGVLAAEYFLDDTDPGLGHGTQMAITDGMSTTTFGSDLPTGVYKVSVRAQDKAGNWSAITSDYLVVYNPFGVRMMGKRSFVPSLANDDRLPGLVSADQANSATFAFSVGFDKSGNPLSDAFQFSYETGTNCKKPSLAQNCHSFQLDALSVAWFTTSGTNSSLGTFTGNASLTVDGATQPVKYILKGLDGDRLGAKIADHLTLQIFAPGDNLSTAPPLYQISDDIGHGNIHIQT